MVSAFFLSQPCTMAIILNLETATSVCSVALAKDGILLALREVNNGFTHSENITNFINEVCIEAGMKLEELDAVAVSKGPGSYTGLRIGVSTAKGLCYALQKPLIAVDTLKSLTACLLNENKFGQETLFIPMIDARRMEVYYAVYNNLLEEIIPASAMVIAADSFNELSAKNEIVLFGDGSSKCKPVLERRPQVKFSDVSLSATGMMMLSEEKFLRNEFEDVSLFEPFYLKDVAIGNPTKF
jgi:tRNA threonylcarbamoyladenosine biosynthesis protein TsaB